MNADARPVGREPAKLGPARRWYDALTSQMWRRVVVLIFCLAPVVSGFVNRIHPDRPWFGDYDAVACAGVRLDAGLDIYTKEPTCEGMAPSGYVYPPFVARGFAWGASVLGQDGLKAAYLAVYVVSCLFLLWLCFLRRGTPGDFWDRAPAFAIITGSTFFWANIALPLHALICLGALVAHRRPWVFAVLLAAAAVLKPVYLVYGLVLLVVDRPLWQRFAMGALAAAAGLAPTVLFALTGGAMAEGWRGALEFFVYDVQPGEGFYGWIYAFGLDGRGLTFAAGWVVYAGMISVCAMLIAARMKLSGEARVWLGVGMACLVNPRLSANDVIPLALAVGSVIAIARMSAPNVGTLASGISDGARRGIAALVAIGVCIGGLGNTLDAGDYSVKIFTLMLSAAVVWLTAAVYRGRAPAIDASAPA